MPFPQYKYIQIFVHIFLDDICICSIFLVQIYSDIGLVNMCPPNIFRYLFGKLCGIWIYSDICSGPIYDTRSSLILIYYRVHSGVIYDSAYSDVTYYSEHSDLIYYSQHSDVIY